MKTLLLTLLLISGKLYADPINTLTYYQEALSNFHYSREPEGSDVWRQLDITEEFVGDCEDFAFSLQAAVKGGYCLLCILG